MQYPVYLPETQFQPLAFAPEIVDFLLQRLVALHKLSRLTLQERILANLVVERHVVGSQV